MDAGIWTKAALASAVAALNGCAGMQAWDTGPKAMTFFVNSANLGMGAAFGGLAGAALARAGAPAAGRA